MTPIDDVRRQTDARRQNDVGRQNDARRCPMQTNDKTSILSTDSVSTVTDRSRILIDGGYRSRQKSLNKIKCIEARIKNN